MRSAFARVLGLLFVGSALAACGHGEDEWQGKLREISTLQGQLREMTTERDRLREQLESLRASNEAMARRLAELGENVNRLQADQARTESELTAAQAREWLVGVIGRNLRCADAEDDLVTRGGVYALVGPTGVGKTTTTAKLAARCAVRYGARALGSATSADRLSCNGTCFALCTSA